MALNVRNPGRRANVIGLTVAAALGTVAAYAGVSLSGTKTGAALATITTAGPVLVYAAIIAPLAFPFGLYAILTPFDNLLNFTQFGTLTRLVGIATGAALLFYMLRNKSFCEPHRNLAIWLLLYLWTAASVFWAIDPKASLQLLPTAIQLLALYAVVAMMRTDLRGLRVALTTAAVGGVVAAFYGLFMYVHGSGVFQDRLWVRTGTSQLNPDHFAASLLMPVALVVVAGLWSRNIWMRAGCLLALIALGVAIALTGSRAGELGLAGLLIYLIIRDPHRLALAVISIATGVTAVLASSGEFWQRWGIAAQTGGAGRVAIWKVGLLAFKENWLFGAGYANFPFAYDHAFIHVYEPFYANWHRASHNILLNTGVELGVIGLVLLLLAWWGQFRMLRSIGATDPRYPVRLALEAAVVGLFIAGLFADIMIEKYVWLAFMLIALTCNALVGSREQLGEPVRA